MKAIIIDDHPLARIAIRNILENNGIEVIDELESGANAIFTIETKRPDVIIIDIDIPVVNGIEVLAKLRKRGFMEIIIIISAKNDRFYGKRSSEVGASGFISKKEGLNNLIAAIQAAKNGFSYFPLFLSKDVGNESPDEERLKSLSLQEFSVLSHILQGIDNNSIAIKMNISHKTVSTYKKRLMEKLECKNLIELYAFSSKNNIG